MNFAGLERLTNENAMVLESKDIYFVGFSSANIEHFIDRFPQYTEKICGIFAVLDIDDRTPTSIIVNGKICEIRPLDEIKSLKADLDVIIVMYEYELEAFEKIRNVRGEDGLKVYWFPDKGTQIELGYRDGFLDRELENIILFKSGGRQYVYGGDFGDNARALFEYMIDNGYNKRWTLVWLVFNPECNDYTCWKQYENVDFIGVSDKESEEIEKRSQYYRYICSAKYAFATEDINFFRRKRNDQILVQLWHGDGVKGRTRFRRMEKRLDYMVCTSRFYAESDYIVFGLRLEQMIPTGLPKDDWVFAKNADAKRFIDDNNEFEHYVLWGPTFRKSIEGLELLDENVEINETGLPILKTWDSCNELNDKLRTLNCLLIIKLHPLADLSIYSNKIYSNIRLVTNQDLFAVGLHINQMMSWFDAFITDYSSAATSFMIIDRPMAFTLDDLDEYEDSRGFVFSPVKDFLPGAELYTVSDMSVFVEDVCNGIDSSADKRHLLCKKMIDYMDGNNTERLLEFLSIKK